MSPLFTLWYWFNPNPLPVQANIERALLVVFVGLLIAGIAVWLLRLRGGYSKEMKKAFARLASHLSWTGLAGLALWAVTYERVPWLSARILFVCWALWFVIGMWFVFRYIWWGVPAAQARRKEREEQQKWLPKKKK